MTYQTNISPDQADLVEDKRKLEVGRQLWFLGYDENEIPGDLLPDSIVTVAPSNWCGMGIDVIGPDGLIRMVWAEEVEVIE